MIFPENTPAHRIAPNGFAELAPAGVMAAVDCRIGWECDDLTGRVTRVLITTDMAEWRDTPRCMSTGGACYTAWCVPSKKRSPLDGFPDLALDPLGTFSVLLALGFTSRRVMWNTVHQFARIKECGWARRMLLALTAEWSEDDLDKPC